jgi:photosystem I subunit X
LLTTTLLAVAPRVSDWSPTVGLIMVICNVLAIAIGKFTIKQQNVGLGLPSAQMFGGMSHGAMMGTTSLGHLLGAGVILGLSNMGVI